MQIGELRVIRQVTRRSVLRRQILGRGCVTRGDRPSLVGDYSCRSAVSGSILEARLAGM
jgi:hypothetical protein